MVSGLSLHPRHLRSYRETGPSGNDDTGQESGHAPAQPSVHLKQIHAQMNFATNMDSESKSPMAMERWWWEYGSRCIRFLAVDLHIGGQTRVVAPEIIETRGRVRQHVWRQSSPI